jgi:uncharacterized protein (TIGR02444 family)
MSGQALEETPLWRFSLLLYAKPNVANACLALQDEVGADINLLLFLLWKATQGRRVSLQELEDVEAQIVCWRDRVVVPLRAVRRYLKAAPPPGDRERVEVFRTRIKSLELEAERLQQAAIYECAQTSLRSHQECAVQEAARANLHVYAQLLGTTFRPGAVETLFAALAAFERNREE